MIMSLIAQSFGNKGKAKGGNLSFNVKGGGGGMSKENQYIV